MIDYVDIESDNSGDLILSNNGDLKIATESRSTAQIIIFRLRTERNDFDPDPKIGAGLDAVVGRPNNTDAYSDIESRVKRSLTRDGAFGEMNMGVKALPVGVNDIGVFISINEPIRNFDGQLKISMLMDFIVGSVKKITDTS